MKIWCLLMPSTVYAITRQCLVLTKIPADFVPTRNTMILAKTRRGITMSVHALPASSSNAMISQNTSPSNSLDEVIEMKSMEGCGVEGLYCIYSNKPIECSRAPCIVNRSFFIYRRDLPKYIAIRLTR